MLNKPWEKIMLLEVDCITGMEFLFEQPKHLKLNDITKDKLGQLWVYQINLQRHIGFTQRELW
jgi:hypothetical protein